MYQKNIVYLKKVCFDMDKDGKNVVFSTVLVTVTKECNCFVVWKIIEFTDRSLEATVKPEEIHYCNMDFDDENTLRIQSEAIEGAVSLAISEKQRMEKVYLEGGCLS